MAETLTIQTAASTEVVKIAVPGPQGATGAGVPTGGNTGQLLRKKSGTSYDTEWADAGASQVVSVNGKDGVVVLTASDVGAATTAQGAKADTASQPGHTHTSAAITDFAAAVVAAAPPTTNASLLTSGTLPDARLSANIARTSDVTGAVAAVVNAAPASLDTLKELADALGNDANFASTVTNSLAAKAPINNPTFTGTVGGVTKSMVGLGNVDNTSDANKPISTATQTALNAKLPAPAISSPSISSDTVLSASRNQLLYLTATGGTTANITLPYASNQNGDTVTLVALFVGGSSVGQLTIRSAGQIAGGSPLDYTTLYTLASNGQAVTLVSDGSNGFGGWSIVSVGGSFPNTSNAVQEYDVSGVLLPNGDSGSAVQLTRNTSTPQTPDGSDRTFNAEQLVYTRNGSTPVRFDTFLKDKSQWFWTSVPATKTSTGTTSQVAYDSNYFYICVAANKWVRIALATNW